MIYLVRHGQTAFNAEGRLQGHVDSELTELGRAQAERVAKALESLVDRDAGWRLVSSPLGRARTTAETISRALGGLPVEEDRRLIEVSFGQWDGRLRHEVAAAYPGAWGATGYRFTAPGCESYESVAQRLDAWLSDLPPEPERRVIAVAHGVTGRVLRGRYAGLPREEELSQAVPQDAVFRLSGGRIERIDA